MVKTDSQNEQSVLTFPLRILLIVSSRGNSIESELKRNLPDSVITRLQPSRITFMEEVLGRHDFLISDLKSYDNLGDKLMNGIANAGIPFVLIIGQSEEIRVLDEVAPKGILWDFVFRSDLRKIPFLITRYFEKASIELESNDVSEVVYQFRIRKLTEQNLQLMDQLSDKDKIIFDMLHDEQKFRQMVEESGDVVYTTNYKGDFTYVNPRVLALTGYKDVELLGRSYMDLVHPDQRDEIVSFYNNQFTNYIDETVKDFTILTKGGEMKWVEQTVKLIRDGNRVKGFQCIVRDVNERKKYEQKLFQHATLLEKTNKELETLAYVASHDLKEPLRKITTFSSRVQALPEFKELSEKGQEYLSRMNAATKRMEVMIEDLLSYSRITRTREKLHSCDLNTILDGVTGELEQSIAEGNAKIDAMHLPVITVIESQIRIVFMHLLTNALKFTSKERSPCIKIQFEEVDAKKVPCVEKLDGTMYFRITFSDNGIGFDNKYCDKIFDIFQRLHGKMDYPGTGIGLAIVKKVAERHGGCVTAKGTPDVGAEFSIFLPSNPVLPD